MKTSSIVASFTAAFAIASLNTSCQKTEAASTAATERAVENGAQFKKGEGPSLTDEMSRSIGLQVTDVSEQKVGSSVRLSISAAGERSATAWLNPAEAKAIQPGMEVRMQQEGSATVLKGTVERIQQAPLATGDSEMTITTADVLPAGSAWSATLEHPAGAEVPAIPNSALLKTAEGTFVYTVNGKFYVRTPVVVGAANDQLVEITDGLYAGDQVVTTPVMSLWMAELQVLRGGKACTCGH